MDRKSWFRVGGFWFRTVVTQQAAAVAGQVFAQVNAMSKAQAEAMLLHVHEQLVLWPVGHVPPVRPQVVRLLDRIVDYAVGGRSVERCGCLEDVGLVKR